MTHNLENPIIIRKKMYYDEYEKIYGDGFYPQLKPFSNICSCKSVIVSFKLIKYNLNCDLAWVQMDGSVIYGFDGNNGIELLNLLNAESKVKAIRILNSGGRPIYPVIPYLSTYRAIVQSMKY